MGQIKKKNRGQKLKFTKFRDKIYNYSRKRIFGFAGCHPAHNQIFFVPTVFILSVMMEY